MEDNQRHQLEKEKVILRKEYQRLNELQDSIKEMDIQKKTELLNDSKKLEMDRLSLKEERYVFIYRRLVGLDNV